MSGGGTAGMQAAEGVEEEEKEGAHGTGKTDSVD